MKKKIDNTPTEVRIEVARISAWTSHLPEDPTEFADSCAVVALLNPDTLRGDVSAMFQPLVAAKWSRDEKSLPGLAKLRIRVLSSGSIVLFEIYIRERWATVLYDGTWYSVDGQALHAFIHRLTEWAISALEQEALPK